MRVFNNNRMIQMISSAFVGNQGFVFGRLKIIYLAPSLLAYLAELIVR